MLGIKKINKDTSYLFEFTLVLQVCLFQKLLASRRTVFAYTVQRKRLPIKEQPEETVDQIALSELVWGF